MFAQRTNCQRCPFLDNVDKNWTERRQDVGATNRGQPLTGLVGSDAEALIEAVKRFRPHWPGI